MNRMNRIGCGSGLALVVVCGIMPPAAAGADLSMYRGFQFGTDLAAIARQTGTSVSRAKVRHSRPELLQDLEWSPQRLGPSAQSESASQVVFSFYNGALYRIAIEYDRYEIGGMTAEDMIEAVSMMYGQVERVATPVQRVPDPYGDRDEVVARWQDPQYSFELIRSSYGPGYRLVGAATKLDRLAQTAESEAKRLDIQDAPQREAARAAAEQADANAKLEKSRLANKARFRP